MKIKKMKRNKLLLRKFNFKIPQDYGWLLGLSFDSGALKNLRFLKA
jgi:hypothetical protein